jgi:hypothetical protein
MKALIELAVGLVLIATLVKYVMPALPALSGRMNEAARLRSENDMLREELTKALVQLEHARAISPAPVSESENYSEEAQRNSELVDRLRAERLQRREQEERHEHERELAEIRRDAQIRAAAASRPNLNVYINR